jgi:hypothetical protein
LPPSRRDTVESTEYIHASRVYDQSIPLAGSTRAVQPAEE